MSHIPTILIVIYFGAYFFFVFGTWIGEHRLLSNLKPETGYSDIMKRDRFGHFSYTRIDPERLTETGRVHLKRLIRYERIELWWRIVGFLVIVCVGNALWA